MIVMCFGEPSRPVLGWFFIIDHIVYFQVTFYAKYLFGIIVVRFFKEEKFIENLRFEPRRIILFTDFSLFDFLLFI
jgi:hypothetical protein